MRAISFFQASDRKLASAAVERGIRSFPAEKYFLHQKGILHAYTAAGVKNTPLRAMIQVDEAMASGAEATRAKQELLQSMQPQMLMGALQALPSIYLALRMSHPLAADPIFSLTESIAGKLEHIDKGSPLARQVLATLYSSAAAARKDPEGKLSLLVKAEGLASTPQSRFYILGDLAEAHFAAGEHTKAKTEARQWIALAQTMPNDWNYGNAIHRGNLLLGRLALAAGDVPAAKEHLLAAGRTKGSPQLNSFGPKWELAQQLLEQNERAVVLDYLSLCRTFWQGRDRDLEFWASAIRSGGTPRLGQVHRGPEQSEVAGSAAPQFRLKDLHGKEHDLSGYKGKVVLLDFWATWCGPCRTEMPSFEKLHQEFGGQDVVILAVNIDEPQDVVATFIREGAYTMPVLLTQGTDVSSKYSIRAFPTLVTVDKEGRVSAVLVGSRSEQELRRAIEAARAGAPRPTAPAATPPGDAMEYLRTGIGLLRQRKFEQAETTLSRALELRENWHVAKMARAEARFELKHFDSAIEDLTEVIRLRPEFGLTYHRRGLAHSHAGRHEQAIPDYTKAIELQPDAAIVYNARGWAQLELGRLQPALEDLNRALELQPALQVALENRLRLYMAEKQYMKAIADGESVLRLNPAAGWAKDRIAEARDLLGEGYATPLTSPMLQSPPEGAVFDNYPRDTILKWSVVTGAAAYEVQIDYLDAEKWASEQGGSLAVYRVTESEYRFHFVGAQPGRWRVWAVSPSGESGTKSSWRTFRYTR
jgi:tetratricopeptide (TPR) repeat protein